MGEYEIGGGGEGRVWGGEKHGWGRPNTLTVDMFGKTGFGF